MSQSKFVYNDFNYLKFITAIFGSLFILASLFINSLVPYTFLISTGWFFIMWALALKRDSEHHLDIDMSKIIYLSIAYILVVIGSIFLKNYRLQKPIKLSANWKLTLSLFLGIVLYILSKALLITIELKLFSLPQLLTVFSISSLAIGKVLHSIAPGTILFTFSLIYYILGFLLFLINLSYNPIEKVVIPSQNVGAF